MTTQELIDSCGDYFNASESLSDCIARRNLKEVKQ